MKRTILILLAMLPMLLFAENPLFGKYATRQDVKYVSISHTMLKAMSSKKAVRLGNVELTDMLEYIDNVLIISTADPSGMADILSDMKALQADAGYIPLLEKNIGGQRDLSLYRAGEEQDEFVLFSLANAYTVVVITGHFSPEQFQSFFL